MATLIFQSYRGISSDEDQSVIAKLDDLLLEHLGKLTTPSRYWTMFRVGKQATRQVLTLKSYFNNRMFQIRITKIIPVITSVGSLKA